MNSNFLKVFIVSILFLGFSPSYVFAEKYEIEVINDNIRKIQVNFVEKVGSSYVYSGWISIDRDKKKVITLTTKPKFVSIQWWSPPIWEWKEFVIEEEEVVIRKGYWKWINGYRFWIPPYIQKRPIKTELRKVLYREGVWKPINSKSKKKEGVDFSWIYIWVPNESCSLEYKRFPTLTNSKKMYFNLIKKKIILNKVLAFSFPKFEQINKIQILFNKDLLLID